MTNMRVFELAKEMNLPAKQLLQRIRKLGIPVSSNFNALSDEQIAIIRKKIGSPASPPPSRPAKESPAQIISTRREDTNPEGTLELDSDTLIGGKRPRRIRRRRSEEVQEENIIRVSGDRQETPPPSPAPVVEVQQEVTEPEEAPVETTVEAPSVETPAEEVTEERVAAPEPKPAPQEAEIVAEVAPPQPLPSSGPASRPTPPSREEEERKQRERKSEKKGSKARHHRRDESENEALQRRQRRENNEPIAVNYNEDDDQPRRKQRKSERRRERRVREQTETAKHVFNPRKKSIKIGNAITVADLASLIGIKVTEILKRLMENGVMASINQSIPGETAALIAAEFDVEVEQETTNLEEQIFEVANGTDERGRAPIVTIMGHVDHGKTSLLDKIRSAKVTEGEAGGITQHIGAYHVRHNDHNITFLDTPGHEAFTAMRARGANITDIVILVVAADDRVQPQTIEAINHARAAEVPLIVAVNKVDKPDSSPQRIEQELLEHNLVSEGLGGDTIMVPVSAKTGDGIDNLLEMVLLQAEVLELKAFYDGPARGAIIESKISRGKGAVGTVLIQRGILRIGDFFLVGTTCGRVRAMFNDHGQSIQEATPAVPVEITGFDDVPTTGETFIVMDDERTARQLVQQRLENQREANVSQQQKTNLENIFSQLEEAGSLELNLLLKADVQGSVEALRNSLSQLGNEKISVRFLHTGLGNVTETDVVLASASNAIIIAFNVQADAKARETLAREGVDLRLYDVIYNAIDDVRAALQGMLAPEIREEVIGRCRVDQIFNANRIGNIFGCLVTEGKVVRNCKARVLRDEAEIHKGHVVSLKRFKDDVREVAQNYECGIVLDFQDVQQGDVIEAFIEVEEAATL
ncbi:MAG: translation initiation factor IF-2 [SAR324 cluster bacterium]|nr:translation initiation factor IF-2 [SAR324 cluster bacterium]